MAGLGYGVLLIAWALALVGVAAGIGAWATGRQALAASARRAALVLALLSSTAMALLVLAFVTRDFSVEYVYSSASRALSMPLTVAAVYSGQKGSLLFWAWMLSLFTLAVAITSRRGIREMSPILLATLFGVEVFFLSVLVFITNPFERFAFTPANGLGLNPLLVDSGMLVHPPLLLSGYVSTAVPFAFAVGALVTGRLDTRWLIASRRFSLVSWTLLSAGNLLGAWWAYHVLGWGGYWGWDPVENSAILPWFAMTAYLHSVMVQERRGMLKTWNLALVISAFLLAMLGTFNVRSGVLASVHAFAESATGPVFFGFLIAVVGGVTALVFLRSPRLRAEHDFHSLVSREAGFVVNNFLFVAVILVTLGGTFYPLVSEMVRGVRVTVGQPFFNQVNGPLLLAIVALMGVGPLLPWREGSPGRVVASGLPAAALGAATVGALAVLGMREPLALLAFAVIAFTFFVTMREFVSGALSRQRMTGEAFGTALVRLVRRDHRRFGGYAVHAGVTVIALAVVASTFFQVERRLELTPGETATVGRFELTYRGLFSAPPDGNGVERRLLAPIDVQAGGGAREIVAERRFYEGYQEPSTKIAILGGPIDDLYVVLQAFKEDGAAVFVVFVNPLVFWLWVGGGIALLGAWMTLWPNPQPRSAPAAMPAPLGVASDA